MVTNESIESTCIVIPEGGADKEFIDKLLHAHEVEVFQVMREAEGDGKFGQRIAQLKAARGFRDVELIVLVPDAVEHEPCGLLGRHWEVPPDRALPDWFEHPEGYPDMTVQERLDVLDEQGMIYWPKRGSVPQHIRYLMVAEGNPVQDIIYDIRPVGSQSKKRLGFPTQKPMALLDRVIRASSNEGDVVFDPFCGCGTTIYAAHEANRQWIGCDVAILAVRLVEDQLEDRYGLIKDEHYEEHGIPNSVESAKALWDDDPFQFEHWAAEYVDGFPTKKTGDKGIDGRIYFELDDELGVMVLSVKGGTVRPTDIRDLRGVLADDPDAALGGFITMREPSKKMREAAAEAGMWEYLGVDYPRIQILIIATGVWSAMRSHRRSRVIVGAMAEVGVTAEEAVWNIQYNHHVIFGGGPA